MRDVGDHRDGEEDVDDGDPTPGNKAGGLTTILEKSLGAVAKSGLSALMDVYRYAEPITARGLVFMDAPGYDPMGATGRIASGANLVAFTTVSGRGWRGHRRHHSGVGRRRCEGRIRRAM